MNAVGLVFLLLFVLFLALLVLHRFADFRKQHPLVLLLTLLSWYLSFIMLVILPLDVSTTIYKRCLSNSSNTSSPADCTEPWSHIPDGVLLVSWRLVYWTSQILTWLLLPFMQSYACASSFSVLGKVRRSLVENSVYYGSFLLLFVALLLYVVLQLQWTFDLWQLQTVCITAANTWGLFLVVLLLGFGLVEMPRSYWLSSDPEYCLNKTYFKVAKMAEERAAAEEELANVMEEVATLQQSVSRNSNLRKHVDTIISKCPSLYQEEMSRGPEPSPAPAPSITTLHTIHKKVLSSVRCSRRLLVLWPLLLDEAFRLDDVCKNRSSAHKRYTHSFSSRKPVCPPSVEWWWSCRLSLLLLKLVSGLLLLLSLLVLWSECTFFKHRPVLSLLALLVQTADTSYSYVCVELVCFVGLLFVSLCVYSSVFRIRVFNFYHLVPHQQSDAHSLQFSAMLFCRLTPPLCLNFLGLIHMDAAGTHQQQIQTSYITVMGSQSLLFFISDGFNIYYPTLLLLLCCASCCKLGSRCLTLLGFYQYLTDDEMTTDLVQEGRDLVRREKRRRQKLQSETWRQRFPGGSGRFSSSAAPFDEESVGLMQDEESATGRSSCYSSVSRVSVFGDI